MGGMINSEFCNVQWFRVNVICKRVMTNQSSSPRCTQTATKTPDVAPVLKLVSTVLNQRLAFNFNNNISVRMSVALFHATNKKFHVYAHSSHVAFSLPIGNLNLVAVNKSMNSSTELKKTVKPLVSTLLSMLMVHQVMSKWHVKLYMFKILKHNATTNLKKILNVRPNFFCSCQCFVTRTQIK